MSKIKGYRLGVKFGDVEHIEIENKLESFQELVGGYIENGAPPQLREHGIVLLCNEEGLLKQLAPNQNLFPFFICGQCVCVAYNDDGDFVSLTDDQLHYLKAWFDALREY